MMKNIIFCIVIVVFSNPLCAQEKVLSHPAPTFVAIIVSELDTSIAWYTKTFGFEVINKTKMVERGFKQANLKNTTTRLELISIERAKSLDELLSNEQADVKVEGFFKLGFTVETFDEWIDHLSALEVKFKGKIVTDPNTNKKMVIILDPDGNRIQLVEQ